MSTPADNYKPKNQFFVPTDDVLGFEYQAYVAKVRSLALATPSEYFELRRVVLKQVKSDAVGSLYNTIFNVLTEGRDIKGNPIGALGRSEEMRPHYPSQKVNDFAIEVCGVMADHLNRAIDLILPDDFQKLAEGKLNLKGRADTIA